MQKRAFVILFTSAFLILHSICYSQRARVDSFLVLLKTDKADTNKLFHLNKLSREYDNIGTFDSAILHANSALQLVREILKGKPDPQTTRTTRKGEAAAYNSLGITYSDRGNYPEALKNHYASLKINEELDEKKGIAASHNNLGLVYANEDNNEEALKNYKICLKLYIELDLKKGIASSYNNIGLVYEHQANYTEALQNHIAALKIREIIKDKRGVAYSYNNIGLIYYDQNNYPEALANHLIALKLREELDDKAGISGSCCNIGQVYFQQKKYKEATNYLTKAKELSKEIGQLDFLKNTYKALMQLDSAQRNFKQAYENYKLYILYRDSLDNEETKQKSMQSTLQYEFDKKEMAAKAEQDKLNAVAIEEKQKQNIIIYAVGGVLLLVVVFFLFLFNRFRITQKQKKIIEDQKVLVDEAYEKLHEKNKEVMDSIRYAHRIQQALITSEVYIARQLKRLIR